MYCSIITACTCTKFYMYVHVHVSMYFVPVFLGLIAVQCILVVQYSAMFQTKPLPKPKLDSLFAESVEVEDSIPVSGRTIPASSAIPKPAQVMNM